MQRLRSHAIRLPPPVTTASGYSQRESAISVRETVGMRDHDHASADIKALVLDPDSQAASRSPRSWSDTASLSSALTFSADEPCHASRSIRISATAAPLDLRRLVPLDGLIT
jgi:hypothetical protein